MLKIVKGDLFNDITATMKEKKSINCPCVVSWMQTKDTKCVCKEFREQEEVGHCHCRRYQKIEN